MYYIIVVPIVLAFKKILLGSSLLALESFLDFIMFFDFLISFITPFYSFDDILIKNIILITSNYIRTWFIIDFISCVPFALISELICTSHDCEINFKLAKLFKCLKLFKVILSKKSKEDEESDGKFSSTWAQLAYFYFWLTVVTHIISCLWLYMGNHSRMNWIILNNYEGYSDIENYVNSIYFHWATIFTIGYGDIKTEAIDERIYNSLLMLFGIGIYSYTVTSMGTLLSKMDIVTIKYNRNLETLYDIKTKYQLKDNFYTKLKRYFYYDYKHNTSERFKFIEELPKKAMKDLLMNMHREIIFNFQFFTNCTNEEFIIKTVLSMRPVRLSKKDKLFDVNEVVEETYFVRRGSLGLHLGDEWLSAKIMEIRKFEHFGDIFCLSNQRTPYSLKVTSRHVDLLLIRKSDLVSISEEFPETFETIFNISKYNHYVMLELTEIRKSKLEEQIQLKQFVCPTKKSTENVLFNKTLQAELAGLDDIKLNTQVEFNNFMKIIKDNNQIPLLKPNITINKQSPNMRQSKTQIRKLSKSKEIVDLSDNDKDIFKIPDNLSLKKLRKNIFLQFHNNTNTIKKSGKCLKSSLDASKSNNQYHSSHTLRQYPYQLPIEVLAKSPNHLYNLSSAHSIRSDNSAFKLDTVNPDLYNKDSTFKSKESALVTFETKEMESPKLAEFIKFKSATQKTREVRFNKDKKLKEILVASTNHNIKHTNKSLTKASKLKPGFNSCEYCSKCRCNKSLNHVSTKSFIFSKRFSDDPRETAVLATQNAIKFDSNNTIVKKQLSDQTSVLRFSLNKIFRTFYKFSLKSKIGDEYIEAVFGSKH